MIMGKYMMILNKIPDFYLCIIITRIGFELDILYKWSKLLLLSRLSE